MELRNEQILEIRYKPNAKLLDYRGSWAEAISLFMELPEWSIDDNSIALVDPDQLHRVTVAFKNTVFMVINSSTANYFPEKGKKLFKFLFELEGYGKELMIHRIGCRGRFYREYKGSFDKLLELYLSRYVGVNETARRALDAEIEDIGGMVNYRDRLGHFNTMSGPMKRDQVAGIFKRDEEYSDVGLFIDIDYWSKPEKVINGEELLTQIQRFSDATWAKYRAIESLVLG